MTDEETKIFPYINLPSCTLPGQLLICFRFVTSTPSIFYYSHAVLCLLSTDKTIVVYQQLKFNTLILHLFFSFFWQNFKSLTLYTEMETRLKAACIDLQSHKWRRYYYICIAAQKEPSIKGHYVHRQRCHCKYCMRVQSSTFPHSVFPISININVFSS